MQLESRTAGRFVLPTVTTNVQSFIARNLSIISRNYYFLLFLIDQKAEIADGYKSISKTVNVCKNITFGNKKQQCELK